MTDIFLTPESSHDENVTFIPKFVALAVVQSYNPRRKVPRSSISMTDLERCLSKACFSASENSGIFASSDFFSDMSCWIDSFNFNSCLYVKSFCNRTAMHEI